MKFSHKKFYLLIPYFHCRPVHAWSLPPSYPKPQLTNEQKLDRHPHQILLQTLSWDCWCGEISTVWWPSCLGDELSRFPSLEVYDVLAVQLMVKSVGESTTLRFSCSSKTRKSGFLLQHGRLTSRKPRQLEPSVCQLQGALSLREKKNWSNKIGVPKMSSKLFIYILYIHLHFCGLKGTVRPMTNNEINFWTLWTLNTSRSNMKTKSKDKFCYE